MDAARGINVGNGRFCNLHGGSISSTDGVRRDRPTSGARLGQSTGAQQMINWYGDCSTDAAIDVQVRRTVWVIASRVNYECTSARDNGSMGDVVCSFKKKKKNGVKGKVCLLCLIVVKVHEVKIIASVEKKHSFKCCKLMTC